MSAAGLLGPNLVWWGVITYLGFYRDKQFEVPFVYVDLNWALKVTKVAQGMGVVIVETLGKCYMLHCKTQKIK